MIFMKKLLIVFLVLAFVLSFVSCNREEPQTETSETPELSSTDVPEDTEPELGLKADLSDEEITIVHWDGMRFSEFEISETDIGNNAVSAAVYERNRNVEELLGVSLNFEFSPNVSSSMTTWLTEWCDKLQNMMDFPPNEVDLFAVYSKGMAASTIRGLNKDMSALNNLDLSKDWWPTYTEESSSVGGKIYYLTGEISPNAISNMYAVFYNKDLLEGENIADPAPLVEGKEWTVDKLIELSSGMYDDVDGVDGKSVGDRFGLTFSWWAAESIVKGAGFTIAEGGDGETPIMLSDELSSSALSDFVKRFSWLCTTNDVFNDPNYNVEAFDAFYDDRAAFWIEIVNNSEYAKKAEGVNLGFLPMPLLDSEQEGYITPLGNSYSNYAIARSCDDDESAAAVLTALAYYGQTLVTPEVYECYFGDADDGATEIFDIMLKTMRCDIDRVFANELRNVGEEPAIAIRDGKTFEEEFGNFDRTAVERDLGILNSKLKDVLS